MEIYLATANPHKIQEIKAIINLTNLKDSFRLISLNELSQNLQDKYQPQENHPSLMLNAQAKAIALFALTRSPVLAEDSGLFVEALGGRPGVFSARYANTDIEKQQRLLKEMEGLKNRRAFFITTLCYLDEQGNAIFFNGKVSGTISETIRGESGFGYDPVFIPDGVDKTFAEMSLEEKNRLSHRRKAIEYFLNYLERWQKY